MVLDVKVKPFLNLGCGKMTFPAAKPIHHDMVDDEIYSLPAYHNVDKFMAPGVDQTLDLFKYPWPWDDDSFSGVLLSHLVEHIPHSIYLLDIPMLVDPVAFARKRRCDELGDGFYAFFSELWRVLEPGAVAHILCPYAMSTGAMMDPTHTRYMVVESFSYLCPNPDAPFTMDYGSRWTYAEQPKYTVNPAYHGLNSDQLYAALRTNWNVCTEFYVKLQVVKG